MRGLSTAPCIRPGPAGPRTGDSAGPFTVDNAFSMAKDSLSTAVDSSTPGVRGEAEWQVPMTNVGRRGGFQFSFHEASGCHGDDSEQAPQVRP